MNAGDWAALISAIAGLGLLVYLLFIPQGPHK